MDFFLGVQLHFTMKELVQKGNNMINMEKFSFAADSIDQDRIPQFLLSDGNKMPCIGYGTFGSDHVEPGVIAENVKVALSLGYRLLDCAPV